MDPAAHVIKFTGAGQQEDQIDRMIQVVLTRYPVGSPVHNRCQAVHASWEIIGWLDQADTDFLTWAVAGLRQRRKKGAGNA